QSGSHFSSGISWKSRPRTGSASTALSKRRSEERQHIGGERRGVRLGEAVLHLAVRTDDVSDALGGLAAGVVRRAVLDAHGARRIGQERVGEVELLGEMPVLFDRVEADAEDGGIFRVQITGSIPEPAAL